MRKPGPIARAFCWVQSGQTNRMVGTETMTMSSSRGKPMRK
jgi:hypothetical protein